ncbi:MAG: phenylpropionate dioxygenase-like ring-hydroxylating dioxygenase large terminal subunit [Gammaproteobacteria bacterium]|jgi:phenylpropionate dioxygenase-like ring-hydroxylating dioxygenase large terminal subunit
MTIFSENPALRDHWYVAASEHELDQGPVGRTVLNENIVIYRDTKNQVIAAPDRCPHRQAPLSAGSLDKGVLSCIYHGWAFGAGGRCVAIPSADPDFPIPGNGHLACINTRVQYGLVWVCLGDNPAELPAISQEGNPAFRRINNPVQAWHASATRMTDNFLDVAHFPWVHTGTFGNNQRTRIDEIELKMLEGGYYGYQYDVVADNPGAATLISGQAGETVSRVMSTGFFLPFAVRSTIAYHTGLEHIILLLTTPIDDLNSYFTFVVWRNDDFSVSAEDVIAFDRTIGNEDKVMLEKVSGVLPLTPKALASTQSDKASTAWRHEFVRLLNLSSQSSDE